MFAESLAGAVYATVTTCPPLIAAARLNVIVVPGEAGRATAETVTGAPSTFTTKLDVVAIAEASASVNVIVKVVPAASTDGLVVKLNVGRMVSTVEEFVADWALKVAALLPVVS